MFFEPICLLSRANVRLIEVGISTREAFTVFAVSTFSHKKAKFIQLTSNRKNTGRLVNWNDITAGFWRVVAHIQRVIKYILENVPKIKKKRYSFFKIISRLRLKILRIKNYFYVETYTKHYCINLKCLPPDHPNTLLKGHGAGTSYYLGICFPGKI